MRSATQHTITGLSSSTVSTLVYPQVNDCHRADILILYKYETNTKTDSQINRKGR